MNTENARSLGISLANEMSGRRTFGTEITLFAPVSKRFVISTAVFLYLVLKIYS
jgi:hypothetical protein